MPDDQWRDSMRMRLHCRVCPEGSVCQHRRHDGSICGARLDPWGWHSRMCPVGQARSARHDRLRDWQAEFHTEITGHSAATEQRVVAWDRTNPNTGLWEEARLDVATRDNVTGRAVYVDWVIACEHTINEPRRQARSNADGLAASNAVNDKRIRYPPHGGELVPMAFESGGRPSDEAVSFVRAYGHQLPPAEQSEVVSRAWRQISRVLQFGNAECLRSSLG
jgi:hypothetical protein